MRKRANKTNMRIGKTHTKHLDTKAKQMRRLFKLGVYKKEVEDWYLTNQDMFNDMNQERVKKELIPITLQNNFDEVQLMWYKENGQKL